MVTVVSLRFFQWIFHMCFKETVKKGINDDIYAIFIIDLVIGQQNMFLSDIAFAKQLGSLFFAPVFYSNNVA